MARTRAQLAAQKGCITSAPKDQGKRPQGIRKHRSTDRTTRLQQRLPLERTECDRPSSSPTRQSLSPQVRYTFLSHDSGTKTKLLKACATTCKRGAKRPSDALDRDLDCLQKRPRRSFGLSLVEDTSDRPASNNRATCEPTNPIDFWAREGQWPQEYFEPDMEHLLARKKSLSLVRKRSNSATSTTPSDQKPREEKSAPYRDPRYKTLLATKGSFMDESDLGITKESSGTYCTLLNSDQTVPSDSLFRDDLFKQTCRRVEDRNEARVIRDITPLIVPSAEVLCTYGAKHLNILIESVNEGWNNSIPLTATRPQPDYSVGFRREAFTVNQRYDHRLVRIYGHYPVIQGKDIKYYRQPVRTFDFTELDGKDKWTAYRFTKNVYDIWMPQHFKRICSAIDQLPADLEFNVPSLAETGLSQSLESHGLSESDVGSSSLPAEDSQPGNADAPKATPDTSFTETGGAKRRKGKTKR
ncbi:hypothetical protein HIM_11107 [Hirsutella minnesotensis 3608]|uniref:DUF7924 domain-containing protein n=1 Tax=Hirsutella minnesotensis 3608 TaxID=1043627 RepID=A0A0F7ZJC1_9HYPO|nr:hypothetical protein HIM_11107 [Hirsutella minnesotensis 3608]